MSARPQSAGDLVEQRSAKRRAARGEVTDTERVLALPVDLPTPEQGEAIAAALTQLFAVERGPHPRPLRVEQALALRALQAAPARRGIVAALQVGGGKTLIGQLAPMALAMSTRTDRTIPQRPLNLVPAPLLRQWADKHREWSAFYRLAPLRPEYVISHDQLSRPDASDLLDRLAPDVLVIDEAHAFRNPNAARTRRLIRYIVANPTTRVIAMTGSLGADTLRDFAHLLELALREGAPIPLNDHLLGRWCAALDHRGEAERSDWTAIWPVVRQFGGREGERPGALKWDFARPSIDQRQALGRAAYGRRLRSTPGVIVSTGSVCGAGLRVRLWRPRPPDVITAALAELLAAWRLPDGVELVDALELDRHRRTLSRGYYNRWRWPDCSACDGRGDLPGPPGDALPPDVCCPTCGGLGRLVDDEWMEARRQWSAAVRNALEYQARAGFDSPALIARAAAEGRVGNDLLATWGRWAAVKDRYRPAPPSEVVWLPGARSWLARSIRAWVDRVAPREYEADTPPPTGADAAEGGPPARGLVWFETKGVEAACGDALGVGSVYGAGTQQPRAGVNVPALSRRVHGTGADSLTPWWHCLVVEPVASGQQWEQLIGRPHRPGQLAPLVRIDVFCPTWVGRRALEEAIAKTEFLRGPGGVGDFAKLIVADFEPPLELEIPS